MSGYACPHCGMMIYDEEALLCHFCGESLGRPSKGLIGQMRYAHSKMPWILIVFFLVVVFVLFAVFF